MTFTKDQLSRGSAYWSNQEKRGWLLFKRTVGTADLQAVLDKIDMVRNIRAACKTYYPCSRECC
jgi:hypothetical protein